MSEVRNEWGVLRTWGVHRGSVAAMDYRDARHCAETWPGVLVKRTVVAGEWEEVDA